MYLQIFVILVVVNPVHISIDNHTSDSWPKFRGDLQNTGYSTSTVPSTNNVRWKYYTGRDVWSSPAVVDGKLFVGCCNNKLYCLDADTGKLIWTFSVSASGWGISSSPAVAYGVVYIGCLDKKFYALPMNDPNNDGKISQSEVIWSYKFGGKKNDVNGSPAVKDGKVFIGAPDRYMYCFNATTGKVVWKYYTEFVGPHALSSSPAIAYGKVFVGNGNAYLPNPPNSGRLYCLNESTGKLLWKFDTKDQVYPSPVVSNGKVYIGSGGDWDWAKGNHTWKFYCLDEDGYLDGVDDGIPDNHYYNSDLIWEYKTGGNIVGSAGIHAGKVYFGCYDGYMRCLDAQTGSLIWEYKTANGTGTQNRGISSSPTIADGKVIFGTRDDKIVCLDSQTGSLVWEYQAKSSKYGILSSAAIVNGFVYIGTNKYVYCFGVSIPEFVLVILPISIMVAIFVFYRNRTIYRTALYEKNKVKK
jgi:outer membrane protein assembly factor BamB